MVSLFKELKLYIALKFNRCDKHFSSSSTEKKNVKYNLKDVSNDSFEVVDVKRMLGIDAKKKSLGRNGFV